MKLDIKIIILTIIIGTLLVSCRSTEKPTYSAYDYRECYNRSYSIDSLFYRKIVDSYGENYYMNNELKAVYTIAYKPNRIDFIAVAHVFKGDTSVLKIIADDIAKTEFFSKVLQKDYVSTYVSHYTRGFGLSVCKLSNEQIEDIKKRTN